jgi:hypothetical protein
VFRFADVYGVEIEPGQNDVLILAITAAIRHDGPNPIAKSQVDGTDLWQPINRDLPSVPDTQRRRGSLEWFSRFC